MSVLFSTFGESMLGFPPKLILVALEFQHIRPASWFGRRREPVNLPFFRGTVQGEERRLESYKSATGLQPACQPNSVLSPVCRRSRHRLLSLPFNVSFSPSALSNS